MLQEQSHEVSTAAWSIYDCDHDICIDQSSHGPETDIEHEEAEFTKYYNESAAHIQSCMHCLHKSQSVRTNAAEVTADAGTFSESVYYPDSNSSNTEEQGYGRILTDTDMHP